MRANLPRENARSPHHSITDPTPQQTHLATWTNGLPTGPQQRRVQSVHRQAQFRLLSLALSVPENAGFL